MAKDERYLKRRHDGWYFAIAVPRGLRGRFISQGRDGRPGKPLSKIVLSLHTRDAAEAQKRRWPHFHEWREAFKRAESGVPLSLGEIETEAREVYTATLERMETEAKRRPADASEQIEALQAGLDAFIEDSGYDTFADDEIDLDQHIETLTEFGFIANELSAVQRRKGVTLDPGSETHHLLGRAITRAIIAASNGRMKALEGKPSDPPASFLGSKGIDPISLRPIAPVKRPQIRVRSDDGMKFSEAAALYIDEIQRDRSAALTEQTRGQMEAVFRLFKDYSDEAELGAVTRAMASDFLATVAKLHPHWGRSADAKKMTLSQLLEQFGDKGETLSNRTLNRYAASLSGVFKWARKRGHIDRENPFADQSRPEGHTKKTGWVPYTVGELNTLLSAPLFNVPAGERVRPAKHTVETALRWVPLIALYSGMRLGEICQLRTSDVRRDGKTWYFNVTEEAEGQSVKTAAGIRRVPVHSVLIRRGLLKYRKALPDGQLWPALKSGGPDGKLSWYLSKRFTEFRRSADVKRPRLAFHSLRKNFATALDNAGANRDEIAALIGHERGFTLETYSGGKGLQALASIVEKVEYSGLKLDHLHVKGLRERVEL